VLITPVLHLTLRLKKFTRISRHLKEKITNINSDFKVLETYNNGEDALIELHWTQPHAKITDIRMPVMDGLELIQKVREKLPEIQCAIIRPR
jgi:two-component system response regulator YesN